MSFQLLSCSHSISEMINFDFSSKLSCLAFVSCLVAGCISFLFSMYLIFYIYSSCSVSSCCFLGCCGDGSDGI
jgi:hypothetical protein